MVSSVHNKSMHSLLCTWISAATVCLMVWAPGIERLLTVEIDSTLHAFSQLVNLIEFWMICYFF